MRFGLQGSPTTFQGNINAYFQALLGQGVIAYVDDVLVYSPDLPSHATLLRQVLAIFLQHQFYPKLTNCKSGRFELDNLGYTISSQGLKPSFNKIQAIALRPEVLTTKSQVR